MAKKPDRGGRRGRANPDPSAEESRLFEDAMRDVDPLDPDDRASPVQPRGAPPREEIAPRRGAAPAPAKPMRALKAGKPVDLDRRTMDRLRRGQIRPEGHLDLHGMTRGQAHAALHEFIATAHAAGKRCVIVITGRGRASFGGGVLRTETPRWLNLGSIRPMVLGFAEAHPKDGGAGALYVLLRRGAGGRAYIKDRR